MAAFRHHHIHLFIHELLRPSISTGIQSPLTFLIFAFHLLDSVEMIQVCEFEHWNCTETLVAQTLNWQCFFRGVSFLYGCKVLHKAQKTQKQRNDGLKETACLKLKISPRQVFLCSFRCFPRCPRRRIKVATKLDPVSCTGQKKWFQKEPKSTSEPAVVRLNHLPMSTAFHNGGYVLSSLWKMNFLQRFRRSKHNFICSLASLGWSAFYRYKMVILSPREVLNTQKLTKPLIVFNSIFDMIPSPVAV